MVHNERSLSSREQAVLDCIPAGHKKAVGRRRLAEITGLNDRTLREVIYSLVVARGLPVGSSTGPDPLEISPVNPLDYRRENGQWVLDPGWWRNIKPMRGPGRGERQSPAQKKQGRHPCRGKAPSEDENLFSGQLRLSIEK
ncbi:MAG: hypothetical protein K6T65_16905 [Peptococcaceae bacterium]|nr:hypothetical protein [Peptococcaceae bacterium]